MRSSSSLNQEEYHSFSSVDGNNPCNWRYNYARLGRRPICKEYSGSSGDCVGASGSGVKAPSEIRYGEMAYIPPLWIGASTVYIENCTDEPLELEFRNRNDRVRPPLLPLSTTKVVIPDFAPPELGLVKTVRVLPGWGSHAPHQYKTGWTLLNAGTQYSISLHEDRLLINDKLDRK